MVAWRAKKSENSSSGGHYDQIRSSFHTAWYAGVESAPRIKATAQQLHDALHGWLTDHHRFLLKLHLGQWDGLDAAIRGIDVEVDGRITRMAQPLTAGGGQGA